MLRGLNIENIAVIEKASIDFSEGFNVLTGETGAGKSIIIDSINAVLGERTSRELVRSGADTGTVSALFAGVSPDVLLKLSEYAVPVEDDGTLFLSRKISRDGKSSCKINGAAVNASAVREIGKYLINIHGQHDSQMLLNEDYHYRFIDMLITDKTVFDEYATSFKSLLETRRALKALSFDESEKEKRIEILNYKISEIESGALKAGEKENLLRRRDLLTNMESYLQGINSAFAYINGSDDGDGAYFLLNSACTSLAGVSSYDSELAHSLKKMYDTLYRLEDIKDEIADRLASAEFDPNELEQLEERLDVIVRLCQKYGGSEQSALDEYEAAVKELENLNMAGEEIERLTALYNEKLTYCAEMAEKLSRQRKAASSIFEKSVMEELAYLDMPNVGFNVNFEKGKLSAAGYDKITFLLSANPGEPLKGLNKIASGGELSRIMLAFKSIIASYDTVGTLIFDEIDTGVSGNAAHKIGLKLKNVSQSCQVVCVTHSAQIASFADAHMLISKNISGERAYTGVETLDYAKRAAELARIMGGSSASETMLMTAKEMLNNNGGYI